MNEHPASDELDFEITVLEPGSDEDSLWVDVDLSDPSDTTDILGILGTDDRSLQCGGDR